jgi:hypothetical protein
MVVPLRKRLAKSEESCKRMVTRGATKRVTCMSGMEYIVVMVVCFILGLLVRSYLPAYFSEKGKNLATKEDIGGITKIVETIRSQQAAELEVVKTALQQTAATRASLAERQEQVLLEFLDECLELTIGKLNTSLGDLPFDGGTSLWQYQTSVDDVLLRIYKRFNRLVVYWDRGSDLTKAAEKFVKSAILFRAKFKKNFWPIKKALIEEGNSLDDKERRNKAVNTSNEAYKTYYDQVGPDISNMRLALSEFITAFNKQLKMQLSDTGIEALRSAVIPEK